MAVRNLGQRGDVGDVAQRVADGLGKDGLGTVVDQRLERCRVARVGKARGDARQRQRVREQVVGAAVQRAGRDDVVARFRNRLDRICDGRLARRQRQRADAAFERSDALLQHIVGRVHDARVDVARHLQVEQIGAVLRVVKRKRNSLVDRHGHRAGRRVRAVAAVDGHGVEFPGRGSAQGRLRHGASPEG